MNLIDEYYKSENYASKLGLEVVKGFQEYILNSGSKDTDIVEGYINTLNLPNNTRATYKKTLRNFISHIVIHEVEAENQRNYTKKEYLIPVKLDGEIVDSVKFIDNLTVPTDPPYNNFNGLIGLTRCSSERFFGELVICYFYPERQQDSYAEFISDEDAYFMCATRNKLDLAYNLGIDLIKEREVLELENI